MSVTPDPADTPFYQQVVYSESQRLLLAVLEDLKPQLAEIYTSCLHLLQYANVPDHSALAAHQARELIEKIPPALGVAWTDARGAVDQFDDLMDHFGEGARAHRHIFENTAPASVEPEVLRYLSKSDATYDWRNTHRAAIGKTLPRLLAHRHPAGPPSPQIVAEFERRWKKLRRFFIGLCHHNFTVESADVQSRLDDLEDLLLTVLRPRPIADFEDLDRLIAEGEGDGHG